MLFIFTFALDVAAFLTLPLAGRPTLWCRSAQVLQLPGVKPQLELRAAIVSLAVAQA